MRPLTLILLLAFLSAAAALRQAVFLQDRSLPHAPVPVLLAAIVAAGVAWASFSRRKPERGVFEMSFFQAKRAASRVPDQEARIYFGGLPLPPDAATSHFMVVGSTGSGKTLTLRMMMGSVLPALLQSADQRAVVFDVKQDVVSILGGILEKTLAGGAPSDDGSQVSVEDHLVLLNPFDARCHAWDIAADVTSPEIALQIATILIPEEQSQNRYFSDAARDLLTGVLNVFTATAPLQWTFSDLLYALRSSERLRHVLSQTGEGRDLIGLHLEGGQTTRSVISTARSKLAPYEVVGALWHHAWSAGRKVSLKDFLDASGKVLVLGNNQAALAPMQAINRVIVQRLTELLLDQTESDTRRTWFFLDEVRKLGKLDGLDDLMTNGRSKGAAVVLGFQDIDGMRAVYGREIAGEITSMPASFGVLRVSGASTPQWASEIFGEQEIVQKVRGSTDTRGHSLGQDYSSNSSSSFSETEQIRERRLYLPSFFRMIPRPERGRSLCGYFCSAFAKGRPYYAEIPSEEVSELLAPRAAHTPDFEPWPARFSRQLPAWDEDDYLRLCLEEAAVATAAEEEGQAQPGVEAEGEARQEAGKFQAPDWLP